MEYLSEKYGLVTDNDPVTENGQEFLAELVFLQDIKGINPTTCNELMIKQLANSKVDDGLYHRNPDLTDRRIMSHDNMSGIMSWSYYAETEHAKEIWHYLITHFGTYDNSQGKSSQWSRFLPFNPSYIFVWGKSAGSWLYWTAFPIYWFSLVIACGKPVNDTTGKILSWIELYPHRDGFLTAMCYRYFERKMKAMYGEDYLTELMRYYHGNSNTKEFPICKLLGIGR